MLFLVLLYILLQCVSKLRNELPVKLQHDNFHSRTLIEYEHSEINNSKNEEYSIIIDREWKKEYNENRRCLYEIDKKLFWNWKKICIMNNIHYKWETERWNTWRELRNKMILKREEKNERDLTKFKNKNPNSNKIDLFIRKNKNSFKRFCKHIIKEWKIFLEKALKDWNEYKKQNATHGQQKKSDKIFKKYLKKYKTQIQKIKKEN
ncbi:Plasmodium exported protein, unknown function [Plasmodium gallinaceum]|uniref:Fam-g protein n=1 Tax=Plasmodium gallinaceum TaxID=5849 RepID=A0A1J1GXQ7_PLAGA|nr:Plasmodium exported protein, unknown function [Plasmodium gallinaceum]CRG96080.1 Plasmodium exported protein, unknown function [Plasmodium gallinaceum]